MKHILGYARKAINDFNMIEDNDKVDKKMFSPH